MCSAVNVRQVSYAFDLYIESVDLYIQSVPVCW